MWLEAGGRGNQIVETAQELGVAKPLQCAPELAQASLGRNGDGTRPCQAQAERAQLWRGDELSSHLLACHLKEVGHRLSEGRFSSTCLARPIAQREYDILWQR